MIEERMRVYDLTHHAGVRRSCWPSLCRSNLRSARRDTIEPRAWRIKLPRLLCRECDGDSLQSYLPPYWFLQQPSFSRHRISKGGSFPV